MLAVKAREASLKRNRKFVENSGGELKKTQFGDFDNCPNHKQVSQ